MPAFHIYLLYLHSKHSHFMFYLAIQNRGDSNGGFRGLLVDGTGAFYHRS